MLTVWPVHLENYSGEVMNSEKSSSSSLAKEAKSATQQILKRKGMLFGVVCRFSLLAFPESDTSAGLEFVSIGLIVLISD